MIAEKHLEIPAEIDRRRVYTFDIKQLGAFQPLWDAVRNSSVVPPLYHHSSLIEHISQLHLKYISDSLAAPPTRDMLQIEKDAALLALRNRSYPNPALPYLSRRNGVVNLKLFMTDEGHYNFLSSELEKVFRAPIVTRGHFLYPPGGFIEWHTNMHQSKGWRMYIIDVDREAASFFRYLDPLTKEPITLWDFKGAVHLFYVGKEQPFWHCVKSIGAHRWSRGFLVPENWHHHLSGS